MKLHKRPVLISGKLSTNEIFDLFQTWQLSILSWSIPGLIKDFVCAKLPTFFKINYCWSGNESNMSIEENRFINKFFCLTPFYWQFFSVVFFSLNEKNVVLKKLDEK